jgi:transcriptional regulator with XRE-family HTH domain
MLDVDKIKSRRESLGLTLQQAAERAGFSSRQQWHNVESGTAGRGEGLRLSTLNAVAKALDCNAKDLLK